MAEKCRFCGREMEEGAAACPFCGKQAESQEALFRRPGAGEGESPGEESEFSQALRWQPEETPEPPVEEPPAEEPEPPKKLPWRRWQKIAAALCGVLLLAGAAWFWWPKPSNLPKIPVLFSREGQMMAFLPGQEGEKFPLRGSADTEDALYRYSPDGQRYLRYDLALNNLFLGVFGGEEEQIAGDVRGYSFSRDSQRVFFIYDSGDDIYDPESAVLYRYEISTGESQRLMTGVASYRMNQDGTLLVDRMNQPILLLDPDTGETWETGAFRNQLLAFPENGGPLYYTVSQEVGRNVVRWTRDGGEETILKGVGPVYLNPDGTGYYGQIRKTISLLDLVQEESLAEAEAYPELYQRMKDIQVPSPCCDLYWFDGEESTLIVREAAFSQLTFLQDEAGDGKISGCLYRPGTQKRVYSLPQIAEQYGLEELDGLRQEVCQWPFFREGTQEAEGSSQFAAIGPRSFSIETDGEDPQNAGLYGDNLYLLTGPVAVQGELWQMNLADASPKPEKLAENVYRFWLAGEEGVLYRQAETPWEDSALYYNGELAAELPPLSGDQGEGLSMEITEDGGVYYLRVAQGGGSTLCTLQNGQEVTLSRNVASFVPLSRDYALFLREEKDGSRTLMAWRSQGGLLPVADQVEDFYYREEPPTGLLW